MTRSDLLALACIVLAAAGALGAIYLVARP
jgi:hypothetical protein